MVRLEKINEKNYRNCIKLEVKDKQKNFVASNVFSLAQAYISMIEKDIVSMPYAIFNDENMVGFVMIEYYKEKGEMVYEIGRMMIDKDYQGMGYGRDAMEKSIKMINELPCGPAKVINISYIPDNHTARKLYLSLGFVETGEMEGDEVCAELKL